MSWNCRFTQDRLLASAPGLTRRGHDSRLSDLHGAAKMFALGFEWPSRRRLFMVWLWMPSLEATLRHSDTRDGHCHAAARVHNADGRSRDRARAFCADKL